MEYTSRDEARFWAKVYKAVDGHWYWIAAITSHGYGAFRLGSQMQPAHRIAYLFEHGSIPEGLFIHHLCYTRSCVNPDHLRPVTNTENIHDQRSGNVTNLNRLKTHCKYGHLLAGTNLYVRPDGTGRDCVQCRSDVEARRVRGRQAS